jgi:Fe-S-cluster containining protein
MLPGSAQLRKRNDLFYPLSKEYMPLAQTPVCSEICRECVSIRPGCCCGSSVPLTIKDINRIAALGHPVSSYAVAGEYGWDYIKDTEPWWMTSFFPLDGAFYKLNVATEPDGKCRFLVDGSGCMLGNARPFVCRIYPFWVNDRNNVCYEGEEEQEEDNDDETCHLIHEGVGLNSALPMLGESELSIRSYFEEIRQDCIENRKQHEQIIRRLLAISGTPKATCMENLSLNGLRNIPAS